MHFWQHSRAHANFCQSRNARNLCPHKAHQLVRCENSGVEPDRICLHCWHSLQEIVEDDLYHVCFCCPYFRSARETYFTQVHPDTKQELDSCEGDRKFLVETGSHKQADWKACGALLYQVRQGRRRQRDYFTRLSEKRIRCSYWVHRAAWRMKGNTVCRHGVFFKGVGGKACQCMKIPAAPPSAWISARFMPVLDETLRCLAIEPFDLDNFVRLGFLQAELRRRCW